MQFDWCLSKDNKDKIMEHSQYKNAPLFYV